MSYHTDIFCTVDQYKMVIVIDTHRERQTDRAGETSVWVGERGINIYANKFNCCPLNNSTLVCDVGYVYKHIHTNIQKNAIDCQ